METQTKSSAKDFFINLGAIVALYALVFNLVNLLFTVINKAYPQITDGLGSSSASISFPVASLVIFFPIFIILMWLLERDYKVNPEKQSSGIHKWLTYITLFISGLVIAGDLITVLYYFIDGEELTTGFLLKILVLLIIAGGVFSYYIMDVLGKLTAKRRNMYRIISLVIILLSIVWGFVVLGSPQAQRLIKYDEQKVSDLQTIDNSVKDFYSLKGVLPVSVEDMAGGNYYIIKTDSQTQKPYEYKKTGELTYELCAEFNNASDETTTSRIYMLEAGNQSWVHADGHYCFKQTINPNWYSKPVPAR